jgi:hypothetical protein
MAGTIAFAPAGGALVNVGKVMGIDGPRPARDALDITPLDAAQGCRVYAAGQLDGGEAVINGFHDRSDPGQAALRAAFATGAAGTARVTLGDGTSLLFPAIVRAYAVGTDSAPVFRAVLRAAGAVVISIGPPGGMG